MFFDEDLNTIPANEHKRKQRLEANKETIEYDAIQTLEDRLGRNKEEDDEIERERKRLRRKKREMAKGQEKKGG